MPSMGTSPTKFANVSMEQYHLGSLCRNSGNQRERNHLTRRRHAPPNWPPFPGLPLPLLAAQPPPYPSEHCATQRALPVGLADTAGSSARARRYARGPAVLRGGTAGGS